MSTSPFMDNYSSEDYSDHDDDYYIVSTPTSPQHVRGQVEIQTQSNDLQNLIMGQHVDVSESVYFDVLPELEAQTAEEEGVSMEQSIYLPVESYFDLEAQVETSVTSVFKAETTVEELAVVSYFDLEVQVETSVAAALDTKTVLEEGDVIESESSETEEADTVDKIVESMIEEFMFKVVEESESDLEALDAIKEPNSDVDHAADVGPEAETIVVEGDVIDESIYKAMESDYDLDAEAEDVVEEEDTVEEDDDMVEEEDDFVKEEDVMVEEEQDVIDDALESWNSLEAEALVKEGAPMEESIYEPMESNSGLQVEEPKVIAELAIILIELTAFKAQELYSESGKQSDSWDDESDPSEEEWDLDDLDVEEYSDMDPEDDSDMDSSNPDQTEEELEEDDVVVSYLKSSTPIQNKAWKSLVPSWAKLPITDIPTLEDSSLLESFLGRGPMLMLQECGNVVMNAIETLLCELSRIRNDLCRVLGALFRQRETTKHA